MKLSILASSSKGNGYVLHNETEALIIEAGVKFREVQKVINFNVGIIQGCIVTHEHGDHAGRIKEYLNNSINVYASKGTIESLVFGLRKPVAITSKQVFKIGNFKILPFDVKHDCTEPFGYLINHPETGNVLFITDSYYSKYTFDNLNHVIIEANFITEIVEEQIASGRMHPSRLNRLSTSHMSLETCKDMLLSNDLSKVSNIVLIHLSDGNSDEKRIKKEITEITGKNVSIATPGLELNFNLKPF